jgi:hypothetical protein
MRVHTPLLSQDENGKIIIDWGITGRPGSDAQVFMTVALFEEWVERFNQETPR